MLLTLFSSIVERRGVVVRERNPVTDQLSSVMSEDVVISLDRRILRHCSEGDGTWWAFSD